MNIPITIEYEVQMDHDVPVDVVINALLNTPVRLILVTPQGQEREALVQPVLGYPQSLVT